MHVQHVEIYLCFILISILNEFYRKPGMLSQFIADLHSGKLHREFHHGPDPTTDYPTPPPPEVGPRK